MGRSFANLYDFVMNPLEKKKFYTLRKKLLSNATGKILEIGSGTGVNFPLYQNADSVIAIEPNYYMIEQSKQKLANTNVPIKVIQTSAEELPFENESFDCVVATLVFCTIINSDQAIEELKRVCKKGGKILLFEHVLMENRFLSNIQHIVTPIWKKVAGGCCLNKDTVKLLTDHNLQVEKIEKYYNGLFVLIVARNTL